MMLQTLMNQLKIRFPNEVPTKGTDINELYYLQGEQSVLAFIQELLEKDEYTTKDV